MSVVLQKHSHHLVLGFSPPNNCKTKSSPTPAYFSPTPVGSFWQIICEIFHYVHRLIKLWPLRLHDSLCFLVTGLSMFPLWCHLRTFKKRTCRPTTHPKGWWSAAWWTTAPCGKVNPAISGVDSELIQVLTYLNETDHLLKGDMGVGGGTLIAVKGLWHRHTQRKTDSDELWWENPCCIDPSKAKTCKALQDRSSEHSERTHFPPVERLRANECTGKSFRHFIKISSHKATGKLLDPWSCGRLV